MRQCTEKNKENNLFNRLAWLTDLEADWLSRWRSTGMRLFLGVSLWYVDQKSLGEFSLVERVLKKLQSGSSKGSGYVVSRTVVFL